MSRFRGATVCVLAALFGLVVHGCALGDDVNGLWQSEEATPVKAEALSPGFEGRVAISLAQYGKDAAGTLFLFTDGFSKVSAYPDCPCLYLESAEYSGGEFTFRAKRCDGEWVLGRFDLVFEEGDDFLRGTVSDEKGVTSVLELVREGDLERVRDEEWNVGCVVFSGEALP